MEIDDSEDMRLSGTEVSNALKQWLGADAIVDVSRESPDSRITGWIMHPHFAGVDRATRQDWVWTGFHQPGKLPEWSGLREIFKNRADQIGMIFTFSPIEYENAFNEKPKTA